MEWFGTFITIFLIAAGISIIGSLFSSSSGVDINKQLNEIKKTDCEIKKTDCVIKLLQLKNERVLLVNKQIEIFIDYSKLKLKIVDSMYTENTPRLTFNGIDVSNGTDFFIDKLLENGFNVVDSDDKNILKFNGVYCNKNVTIELRKTPNSNLINFINVFFDKFNTYDELKDEYVLMTDKLTEKYGKSSNYKLVDKMFDSILKHLNDCEYNDSDTTKNVNYLMNIITANNIIFSEHGVKLTKCYLDENMYCNVLSFIDPINFKIGVDEYNENKKKAEIDLTNL